jgi:hypothetical protein
MKCIEIIVLLFLSITIYGCSSSGEQPYLKSPIGKFAKDSFDVGKALGKGFKVIESKIKCGKILLVALKDQNKTTCFIIGDLKTKKIERIINDPANDMYSVFDVEDSILISCSPLIRNKYYRLNLGTNEQKIFAIEQDQPLDAGNIILNKEQLFITNDVYGANVIDLRTKNSSHSLCSVKVKQ